MPLVVLICFLSIVFACYSWYDWVIEGLLMWESFPYLTLLCVAMWVFKLEMCPNALSQTVHWYGVAELWVVSCFWRCAFCRNLFWHTWHSNGRSPVVEQIHYSLVLLYYIIGFCCQAVFSELARLFLLRAYIDISTFLLLFQGCWFFSAASIKYLEIH